MDQVCLNSLLANKRFWLKALERWLDGSTESLVRFLGDGKMEKVLLRLNELLLSENPAATTDTHSVLLA